ncbi:MAG: class I SAM-dependent methyltransferase [Actinobacteria bacterium]|nr:class I SAM-dependent methyltransferase [Actinomycetota bacterium]
MNSENKIKALLIELGIITEDSIAPYFPKVRDRDDVSVLKCNKSDVIFLSRSDHMSLSHYNEKKNFNYSGSKNRKNVLSATLEDTQRRFEQFKLIISNKKWVDIGTGAGGILDLLSPIASETMAVEPQESLRNVLAEAGYKVFSFIDQAPDDYFDIATLFHVFEHFTNPIEELKSIRKKMIKGAKIIIEVPHARDFLISILDIEAYKAFTFWSEHLILHTRESLNTFLQAAGFSRIVISNFQRYPLANHLYWLAQGKPGGHIYWHYLRTPELHQAYANMLSNIDRTDTLIAIAEN